MPAVHPYSNYDWVCSGNVMHSIMHIQQAQLQCIVYIIFAHYNRTWAEDNAQFMTSARFGAINVSLGILVALIYGTALFGCNEQWRCLMCLEQI